ncbi:alpha/beta fold hydrolase [Treponema sp. OMZ 840]|uniref:alpha/beta fold hydrolase n=1 Tax=Treponema sp. OMZ 840 TaxID=244313 RepID=UPI003D916AA3
MHKTILNAEQKYPGFEALKDTDFAETMQSLVVPFLNKFCKKQELTTKDGKKIQCEIFVPETFPAGADGKKECRGLVVVFHGFCEFSRKYDEFTYCLLKQGYALCRFDQYGHGFSHRDCEDLSKVYIKRFQTYVDCAYEVVEQVARPLAAELEKKRQKKLPLFLFGHSMGGAVGALFLARHPGLFTAAVFSAPMFGLYVGGLPKIGAHLYIKLARFFGGEKSYISGHGAFDGTYRFPDHKKQTCSQHRFLYHFGQRKAEVRFQTWGATYAWLDESFNAIKKILKKRTMAAITDPVLLFQAEKDDTVPLEGHIRFAESVPSVRLVICEGANHELYNGTNETVARWYPELFRFFDEFTP